MSVAIQMKLLNIEVAAQGMMVQQVCKEMKYWQN
jgi:hypothetical protein